jgi:hypothetical protein
MYIRTFKGYEDKTAELDRAVNAWIRQHRDRIEVIDVKTALSHEDENRARSGDLIYTVLYRAQNGAPIDD